MRSMRWFILTGCLAAGLAGVVPAQPAAKAGDAIHFSEVYELLRENLKGVDERELDRAAVQGLLKQLNGQATLLGDTTGSGGSSNAPVLSTALFDNFYGYLRVARVEPGLDEKLSSAYRKLAATNKLKGLVLDLRFAGGEDYAAAAAAAELFFSREQPLIDWGDGLKRSKAKSNAIVHPLTLLINHQTAGAAEAFAGMLREGDVGLLIGTNTAGRAYMGREFALKSGQRLRIATTPIKLGDGRVLKAEGLKPDIHVDVNDDDERIYFEDAYKVLPKAGASTGGLSTNSASLTVTNRPRRRINEAELVRMLREGQNPDDLTNAAPRESGPAPHVVNDPALARAIDLLKGLAVVQQFRSI